MKLKQFGWTILLALAAGGAGYYLGARQEDSITWLSAKTIPRLDYCITQESFSEIENTKAVLEGLCAEFRTEVQSKRVRDHNSGSAAPATQRVLEPGSEPHLENAIADLERGIREFSGT